MNILEDRWHCAKTAMTMLFCDVPLPAFHQVGGSRERRSGLLSLEPGQAMAA